VVAGAFNGLVGDQQIAGDAQEDRDAFFAGNGFLSLTTKASGTFTGSLRLEGKTHSFKGKFDSAGEASPPAIKRPGKSNAAIHLKFDPAEPDKVTGTVTTGSAMPFELSASLHDLGGAKRYTIVLPAPDAAPAADAALGHGYATMVVATTGVATLAGKLADGTTYTTTSRAVDDGSGNWLVPVHIPLYTASKGMLVGQVLVPRPEPEDSADVTGALEWLRPPNDKAKAFKAGFLQPLEPTGESYQPEKGKSLLTGTDASSAFNLTADPESWVLTESQELTGTWPKTNAPSLTKPAKMTLTLKTGVFKGTFLRMVGTKKISTPYEGVILANPLILSGGSSPVRAGGFFSTGTVSGPVELTVP
jgi:hypothetical protein